jgi:F-type H+-transporting ATPase subunit delta
MAARYVTEALSELVSSLYNDPGAAGRTPRTSDRLAVGPNPMLGHRKAVWVPGLRVCFPAETSRCNRPRTSFLRAAGLKSSDGRQVADKGKAEGQGVSGVAGRYATALFELARDGNAIDAVSRDLDSFERMLAGSPDLARLVKSPVFTAAEQTKAIGTIMDRAGIDGLVANLIRFVAAKRRLFLLPEMIRGFRSLVAQSRGIVSASVTVAEEPSPRMLADIKSALRDMAGSDVDVGVKVDPTLIGGMIVKIGSRMVDASLKTKLNSIRIAMKEAR